MRKKLCHLFDRFFDLPWVFNLTGYILEAAFKAQKDFVKIEVNNTRNVLEIGCGTGRYAKFFKKDAYIGVDITPKFINYAKRKSNYDFRIMDIRKLSFKNGSFDKVFSIGVLHHLNERDLLKTLQEVKRVLKPGGKLLVMEDIPIPKSNLVGHLLQKFDRGASIRAIKQYASLFSDFFYVGKQYFMRSGFWEYCVFILENKKV